MNELEKNKKVYLAVRVMRWRHFGFSALIQTLKLVTAWNFIAGVIFLVLRHLQYFQIDFIGFSAAGLPVCFLAGMAVASRQIVSDEKLVALIDSCNNAGGLLLASFETGDLAWENRTATELQLPEFAVDYTQRLPGLLLSLVFLLLCVNVPVYSLSGKNDPRIQFKEMREAALEQIEILAETGAIEIQEAEILKGTVEQISEASDRNDPSKTFEALDQLQEKLRHESALESQKEMDRLEELGSLSSLADKLSDNQGDLEKMKEAARELMKQLSQSEMGQKMQQQGAGDLSRSIEKALSDEVFSAEEAQNAAKELKDYIAGQAEKIKESAGKMLKARLIDRQTFEKLQSEGRIKPLTAEELARNPDAEIIVAPGEAGQSGDGKAGEGQSGELQMLLENGQPGIPGGAGRDSGTAPLQYNRKTSEHGVTLTDEQLPAPKGSSLDNSITIGMGITAPQLLSDDNTPSATPVNWKQPGKLSGESDIILPRHRNAVKKYFDRGKP